MKKEQRILTKNRMMEYLTIDGLCKMTGVNKDEFHIYILKELIDNALDAAELDEKTPEIKAYINTIDNWDNDIVTIRVIDDGRGMTEEMIYEITNFERFGGTKYFLKKPTRGAQGNALLTILGIPTALALENKEEPIPIEIITRGQEYFIKLSVDTVLETVKTTIEKGRSDLSCDGTSVKVTLSTKGQGADWATSIPYKKVVEDFALWNPHATFIFNWYDEVNSIFEKTTDKPKKYFHDGFGCTHWYTLDNFEALVNANIRYLEENNKKESIINFARHFKGCTSCSSKFTKDLLEGLPKNLNDLRGINHIKQLFQNIKTLTNPPAPSVLGEIGGNNFFRVMDKYEVVPQLYKYKKTTGMLDGTDIPFVLETAIAPTNKLEERIITFGINNTITYRSPFEEDLYFPTNINMRDNPWEKQKGLRELLSAYKIHPSDPVYIAIHLTAPNIRYGNYGKSTFDTGGKKY